MYKLIAIDMDGTLLNDQHQVTEEVKRALIEAKAIGVTIVLCTGRPLGGVTRYLTDLELNQEGDYVIAYNGALVQDSFSNKAVVSLALAHSDLQELAALAEELDSPMHFFDAERLYTANKDISPYTVYESYVTQVPLSYCALEQVNAGIEIPKVMFIDEPGKLEQTIAKIPASYRERYTMVKSAPFFYEILHPEVSKGNAVKHLAEKLGIRQNEVMCIGDNGNDLSMITYAGCGVAMANAIPELKAVADVETLSNNQDGVAHAIREYVLKK
ncbi:sugar-phosphatase [Shouchella patagoniensis]|uniref:sugar-phosphatase n=1 Tax=Shouchella patagoniensis TaxID=228576 RepID=UPI000995AD68|nr:sugar-phosphatase [Shouchella patagoniensis]